MNTQTLRYFAITAKLENVSRTAELMHTSQSSISKNILSLEEELGVRLFDRCGKKLFLNDAGRRFLRSCERILEETETVSKDLRQMSAGGDRVIRICTASFGPRLYACLSAFGAAYPEVEYRVDTLAEGTELPDINEYDLLIYPDEIRFRKFKGFDFYQEKYLFAVKADSPLAGRVSVPVSIMKGMSFVFLRHRMEYEYQFHVCLAQNIQMKTIHFVDSREQHLELIAGGIAGGFVPEGSAGLYKNDRRIRLLHLTDDRFTRPIKICFKREKHLSEFAGVFKEFFLDYFNLREK